MSKFKVTFTLDESDAQYFRTLYRKAKRSARELDADQVIQDARGIVTQVRGSKKTPQFVIDSIAVLADDGSLKTGCVESAEGARAAIAGHVPGERRAKPRA